VKLKVISVSIVKICGLKEIEHIQKSASWGANLLGMVFVEGAKRTISINQAILMKKSIATVQTTGNKSHTFKFRFSPSVVGVFYNQNIEYVKKIVDTVGLDVIQLTGDEKPEDWLRLDMPIIKVCHVDSSNQNSVKLLSRELYALSELGIIPLLDTKSIKGSGGTGEKFNWDIAFKLREKGHNFMLAGGLDVENVSQAISQTKANGVDVSTGVETNGIKDLTKIQSFINLVHSHTPGEIQ
tara:strand:- start:16259 stop:16978 length:720 start_codon:yes stop_codon:yes gene_type:complete